MLYTAFADLDGKICGHPADLTKGTILGWMPERVIHFTYSL
jgi:hypothetical protein